MVDEPMSAEIQPEATLRSFEEGNCPHCGAWVNFRQEAAIDEIPAAPAPEAVPQQQKLEAFPCPSCRGTGAYHFAARRPEDQTPDVTCAVCFGAKALYRFKVAPETVPQPPRPDGWLEGEIELTAFALAHPDCDVRAVLRGFAELIRE